MWVKRHRFAHESRVTELDDTQGWHRHDAIRSRFDRETRHIWKPRRSIDQAYGHGLGGLYFQGYLDSFGGQPPIHHLPWIARLNSRGPASVGEALPVDRSPQNLRLRVDVHEEYRRLPRRGQADT